ncbi:hypothetical protein R1sor_021658 [Riccia sorocarpa]|uniref:Uncharacterized protein n=1 Tax=Riccia sorocarpa TaxID=122646 RepID=A0ABD3GJK8_9MARC
MDPRVQGGRPQNDTYGQKGRPLENLYQQRGKQPADEQFGEQRGRQDDSSTVQQQRRGKQQVVEEQKPIGGQRGWGEDPFARGKQPQIQDPFAAQRGNLGDPFRSISPSSMQESSPKYQETSTRLQTAKEPYAQLDFEEPDKPASSYYGGHAELHDAPGPAVNPALTTMVKMVTMLNFMKVELGETKSLKSGEQWRAAGAEFIGTLLFVYLGCGSVVATGMQTTYIFYLKSSFGI